MYGRICRIDELSRDKAIRNLFCQFIGLCDRTLHALGSLGKYDLGTICFENIPALHAHGLGHGQDYTISLCGRDGCQTYTGITRCWFDDDRSFFEDTLLLGVLDHCLGDTVLYTACGIEVLELDQDRSLKSELFLNICNLNQRSITYQP